MSVNVTVSIEGFVGSGKTITRKLITEALEKQGLEVKLLEADSKKESVLVKGNFNYEK
jgi:thymidylate kinase